MLNSSKIEHDFRATGKISSHELEVLRQGIYCTGRISRQKADFLVELHKTVRQHAPAFEGFFYQAVKDHVLADGQIDAEGAAWLRRMVFADGAIADRERKLLHELKGEARQVSTEFEMLFKDCMKQPQEQHTSG